MNTSALKKWLSEPRTALVAAVAECVRSHVAEIKSRGIRFYGYALLPGEPYDIGSLVAVANGESDIKISRSDDLYRYYRFSVDEWEHWERHGFEPANELLAEANAQFAAIHAKGGVDCTMDEFEVAHSDALLDAVLRGLEAAKGGGAFDGEEPFLAIWISDSGHPIMEESVRRLNSKAVVREFMAEFG